MEGRFNVMMLLALVVATVLHGSSAQTPSPTFAPQPSTQPPVVAPEPSTRPPVAPPQPSAQPPASAGPSPARNPTTFTVGDNMGWIVPPNPNAYQVWAQGKTFAVGDILVFNFPTGRHDVVEVTKSEYDSCTTNTPPTNTGPARVTLNRGGEHYYICTFGNHCSDGQKLAINVTGGGSSGAPSPTTPLTPSGTPSPTNPLTPSTPSSDTTPPPGSNSAPSVAVAGLPFALLAAAVAFLFN